MPEVKCKICDEQFYIKPSHQKRGWGKYCSIECRNKSQLRGKFIECSICGEEAWKTPRDLKQSKSGKFFCSKSCQTMWRNKYYSGPKHSNWRGGGRREYSRKKLIGSGIMPICKICSLEDKRLLVVHHRDNNYKNHKLNNLIWLCLNCHYLVHKYNERIK